MPYAVGVCFQPGTGTAVAFDTGCPEGWESIAAGSRPDSTSCWTQAELDLMSSSSEPCPRDWTAIGTISGTTVCATEHIDRVPVPLTHDIKGETLPACPDDAMTLGPFLQGSLCHVRGATMLLRFNDEMGVSGPSITPCPFDYRHVGFLIPPGDLSYAACVAADERVIVQLELAADGAPLLISSPCPVGWVVRSVWGISAEEGTVAGALCEWRGDD